ARRRGTGGPGNSGAVRGRSPDTERRGPEARRGDRRDAGGRVRAGRVGRRAGLRRILRGRPPGTRRGHDGRAQCDGNAVLRRGEGLHEEGGLALAARTAARTDTGRVRENNEDRYLVREGGSTTLLAVAD